MTYFIEDVKKIVPKNIPELISPLALAVWFMDDGNVLRWRKSVTGYHINSQSFSQEENELLVKTLKAKFGIVSSLQHNHGKFRIYIRAESKLNFQDLVRNFMLPSMMYKLG